MADEGRTHFPHTQDPFGPRLNESSAVGTLPDTQEGRTEGRTVIPPREDFPPIPQGVFGVCEGCGAVAWELLNGISTMCLGCAPWDYSRGDDEGDYDEDDWETEPWM